MLLSSGGFNRTAGLQRLDGQYSNVVRLASGENDALAADVTGNGRDEVLTVWRQARIWAVKDSNGNLLSNRPWGEPTDFVHTCDWDGDGKSDRVVTRFGTNGVLQWFVAAESGAVFIENFGLNLDEVSCKADYDGDGQLDMRAYRNSSGNWYLRNSNSERSIQFGLPGDIPL